MTTSPPPLSIWANYTPTCSVPRCNRPVFRDGLCEADFAEHRDNGGYSGGDDTERDYPTRQACDTRPRIDRRVFDPLPWSAISGLFPAKPVFTGNGLICGCTKCINPKRLSPSSPQ